MARGWHATGLSLRAPDAPGMREVLGSYPTGVAAVTAVSEGGPVGMAVNSFSSVSLDPSLVLFCPALSSTTWPAMRAVGQLGISFLSVEQLDVSALFGARRADRHPDVAMAFTAAYLDAVTWSLDPANREQAVALLASELEVTSTVATGLYPAYVDPRHGLVADGMVSQTALRAVLDLRARYGGFHTSEGRVDLDRLSRPGVLYDLTTAATAHQKRSVRSAPITS